MTMTAEQLAQLREVGEKRFLFTATVKHVEGYQTFFVDAETQEKAEAGIENGEGQIYEQELDVTDLDDFILDRVTTTDDFGDYPPISEADLVRMEYNAALCEMLPGIQYMDLPDGGSVTPLEQMRRMVADYRQRIAELESTKRDSARWFKAFEKAVSVGARYEERIAELEARTVTVKLPESPGPMSLGAKTVYCGIVADVVASFQQACAAAGINLTVEG
ncbi:hypothetical protein [Atlantibacter hermannii]|uniref:hypothetical protein n=1 Tax=Atlantibacter hermannii TaxID=565 RepID=UPI0028AC2E67|nr:hypothetical protein [Atlantibacter hermannii]